MTNIQSELSRGPYNPRMIVCGAFAGLVVMIVLLTVIIAQFRAAQLREAGEIGGAYFQGFLAPYAQEAHLSGGLSAASQAKLAETLSDIPSVRQFDTLRIWSIDEVLWFDSGETAMSARHDAEDLREALAGRAIAVLEFPDEDEAGEPGISYPYIEIYAPIFAQSTRNMIAVGEIYLDARPLLAERADFERKVWGAVGLATIGFLAMMFLIARQHRQLVLHIEHQREIAKQNQQLHEAAEAAWQSSGQAHEALLNHLGAELHDGPIQMLSLLALMKHVEPVAPANSLQHVAGDVLADLRRISAGLILPELGDLSVRETLMLAISRHASATGTEVTQAFGPLPDHVDDLRKTCAFRIVQEGLNNAFRHGGAFGQHVTARMENRVLIVTVANGGNGPAENSQNKVSDRHTGLGVIGLRNRLKVFGGTLDAELGDDGGFVLSAQMPLA